MSTSDNLLLQYAYENQIRFQAQQRRSALETTVLRQRSTGERKGHNLFGKITPTEVTGRNQDTPISNMPQDRRWSVARQWVAAELFDKFDELRTEVGDVNSSLIRGNVNGLNRIKDQLILGAVSGTAITGQTGTGSQALPSAQLIGEGDHTFDEAKGTGDVGLTYYKLLAGKEILDAAYGQDAEGRLHCAIYAKEKQTLIASTKTSSMYYVPEQLAPFASGQVSYLLGVNFHLVSDDMLLTGTTAPDDGGTDRLVYMWYEEGVSLDVNEDLVTRIDQRTDKNMAWQAYARMTMGAVRLDDKAVVSIQCDPTTMF